MVQLSLHPLLKNGAKLIALGHLSLADGRGSAMAPLELLL
jgi:hypothetical protein